MSPALKSFLEDLRQHPLFPELIRAVEAPQLPQFRISEAEQVERARAKWIFESGRKAQHDAWMRVLTGKSEVPDQE